jgi:subtilisin family serine protease
MTSLPVRFVAFVLVIALASCGGGGSGSSGVTPPANVATSAPTVSPTTSPTTSPVSSAAFTCPTSDTAASVARSATGSETVRQHLSRAPRSSQPSATLLAVTYDSATVTRSAASVTAKEQSLGASTVRTLDFTHVGRTTHILSVPAANAATIASSLRAQAGVASVGVTGYRRHTGGVSARYFTNDPYFAGFAAGGTFHVAPYAESATVPGQWDMHAIGLDFAFAYAQAGNGSGIVNPAALGSSSVKVAVIDTGEDTTHPELSGKIAYQKCFITAATGVQSTSNFTTDPQGHGTDVAGISGAATNNGFGFVGTGGNVSIYGYRVFPTPDDTCASPTTTSAQCSTSTADIASAIVDAVNRGVNVINMSLGGDTCTNGQDNDPVEGAAVADAIAANVVVVAAAGNDGSSPLEAPACDPGVIAAGASALGDGQPNGTSSVGSASAPVEYVASYSDWGTPAAMAKSASAWGIVAPGGDPNGNTDPDDLHWIEHIWTSTPFQSSPTDTTFAGSCTDDFPNSNSTAPPVDCRTEIAGTSMASPHVAGAAALILSVNPGYGNPTAMKTLLCTTADDIGDPHEGCGRLNIYRAMAKALSDPNLP